MYSFWLGHSCALLQAQRSAAAILSSREDTELELALTRWWRERDVDALPLYYHARDLAEPDVRPDLDRLVIEKIAGDPRLLQAFTQIFRRQQSPYTLLPVGRALGWIIAAALRGQPGLLRDFIARREQRLPDTVN